MNFNEFNSWIIKLNNSKPYRIVLKQGKGFFELLFLYNQYHYSRRISVNDLDNEIECQKKILGMCNVFENNFKLLKF